MSLRKGLWVVCGGSCPRGHSSSTHNCIHGPVLLGVQVVKQVSMDNRAAWSRWGVKREAGGGT